MTSIIYLDEVSCAQLPATQRQQINNTPICRAQTLVTSVDVWENYYQQELPSVTSPWWAQRQAGQRHFRGIMWVDDSLPYFTGHFPGKPILPGVVQIQWALDTADEVFPDTPATRFAGMSQIKFKTPIEPGTWLQLTLAQQQHTVTFEVADGQSVRTQGRLQYHE
jgi:ApeI dehydratase